MKQLLQELQFWRNYDGACSVTHMAGSAVEAGGDLRVWLQWRPPLDNVNALLSFIYTLLANDTRSALEAVGLDAYVGFLHRDRPGRASLALDLVEELRGVYADRFVLSLINRKIVDHKGFHRKENGAVIMDDDTRRKVLSVWQEKKQETIQHPFLQEKISWGLVPYAQALLLARHVRGDLDEYPPFLWK
ncbi:hypothetical protein XYCOK13_07040 [Xylanibacillus composti]|uniref:CRISPR-associated endonuclease Cas1 n=1 Tax=Xylanibacillus composti TaxID=1572762 RepID=A0A8J4M1A5_9BACL|nr:hypothetical protein XYCOK13_07040 [Xylanibacillus composti]